MSKEIIVLALSGISHKKAAAAIRASELQSETLEDTNTSAASLAERVAGEHGGPLVRAVVVLDSNAPSGPVTITSYPRLVIRMSPAAALAYSIENNWNSFLVADLSSDLVVSAFWWTPAGLQGQQLKIQHLSELNQAGRILNIERCVLAAANGEASEIDAELRAGQQFREIAVLHAEARVEGATRYASSRLGGQGVRHASDVSSIAVQRSVQYAVLRPARAVFDIEEPTLAEVNQTRPVLLAVDQNVAAIYREDWRRYAREHLNSVGEFLIDPTESSKDWSQVHDLCGYAARCCLPRDGVVVAVGGGVALDLAGFAASVFRRGVRYVRIPTSLVGLVDVAVGIKQGVNAAGKKNLLGSFYPPLASINDYRFLRTLPRSEIACGLAEILKIALLRDTALLGSLEEWGEELVASHFSSPAQTAKNIVLRAELLMLEELAPNLFEEKLVRLVDFGHSFSPAIEIGSGFQISHGKAVGFDILISTALAVVLGRAPEALLSRLMALLPRLGLPTWSDLIPSSEQLFDALQDIKRHRGGCLNLILVSRPGRPEIHQSVSRLQLDAAVDMVKQYREPSEVNSALKDHIYERTAI